MEKGGTEEEEEEGKPIHLSCVALNFPSKGKAKKKRKKTFAKASSYSSFPFPLSFFQRREKNFCSSRPPAVSYVRGRIPF